MKPTALLGLVVLFGAVTLIGCFSAEDERGQPQASRPLLRPGASIDPRTVKMLGLSYAERQKLLKDRVLHDGMKLGKHGDATHVFTPSGMMTRAIRGIT